MCIDAVHMNPNASIKSLKTKSLCNLPLITLQPGKLPISFLICSSVSFVRPILKSVNYSYFNCKNSATNLGRFLTSLCKMSDLKDELHQQMIQAIRHTVDDKKIGIAFSGGVDSSLLAKLCTDLGYDVILLTIGFENSHDIEFSK